MPAANGTAKRDYYEVLSVERTATVEVIKKSYRRLAMKYHPDRNGGDAEADAKFRECAEAYEVLSDDAKRQRYDQFGHQGVQGAAHDFRNADVSDIFSMFEDIFGFGVGGQGRGRGGRRSGPRVASDLETTVELSLEEVAVGIEKTLEFDRLELCEPCNGRGAKPDAKPQPCPTCNGQGRVAQQGFGGMFRMVVTCPDCRGRGATVRPDDVCPACRGAGRVKKKRVVTIKIPAGIHEGQAVRLSGEGEPGEPGAPSGDLLCYVGIKTHKVFGRQGNDLVCQVPVSFSIAALGGTIDVPVLGSPAPEGQDQKLRADDLTLPAGTQHGEVLKLRGKGLPDVRGGRNGDLLIQVLVEIPKRLTDRQKQLLREFADTEETDGHREAMPQRRGFMDKLRSMIGAD